MTRRRRLRRRFVWAVVLLGLVLLLATVSVLRVGIWMRSQLMAAARRIRFVPLTRKENTMYGRTSFVVVAAVAALLLAAPASADRWGADRRDMATASAPDGFERAVLATGVKQPQVTSSDDTQWKEALKARSQALNEQYGLGAHAPATAGSAEATSEPAWARALRLRSEALNRQYGLGAWQHRTTPAPLGDEPAWLRALRIRSEALNQQYRLGEYGPRS